jgi:hypothetical protein
VATIFRFDRSGSAAMFYLVEPPVYLFNVAAARAAIGFVHRGEGILTVCKPDAVASVGKERFRRLSSAQSRSS